jgi:hypothetical protein
VIAYQQDVASIPVVEPAVQPDVPQPARVASSYYLELHRVYWMPITGRKPTHKSQTVA